MNQEMKNIKHGEIYISDSLKNDKVREFFSNFAKEFVKSTVRYYNLTGEFPFIYGERQINSIIFPSFYELTKEILMEQPFKTDDDKQRFLDYYIGNNQDVYLLELKHGWDSYKTKQITENVADKWLNVVDQTRDITLKSLDYLKLDDINIYKISLMILPTYISHDDINSFNYNFDSAEVHAKKLDATFKKVFNKTHQPNWIAVWKLNKKFVKKSIHQYKKKYQIYPYVSLVVKISSV